MILICDGKYNFYFFTIFFIKLRPKAYEDYISSYLLILLLQTIERLFEHFTYQILPLKVIC